MKRAHGLLTLAAVLAFVGLTDSLFLSWDHQLHLLDPGTQAGLCGAGSGCEISRDPRFSEIPLPGAPGLPLSLLGAAFYAALLLVCWRRWRAPREEAAQGLLLLAGAAALFVSGLLALLSLKVQGALCPYCAILYGVNLLFAIVAWFAFEGPRMRVMERWPRYLVSRSGLTLIGGLLVFTLVGFGIYVPPLLEKNELRQAALLEEAKTLGDQPPVAIDLSAVRARAGEAGPVLVVEIADLACPHCHELYDTLRAIHEASPERLSLALVHYPLDGRCNPHIEGPGRSFSCRLAAAAICAEGGEMGAQYLQLLFESSGQMSVNSLVRQAARMGYSATTFERCLTAPQTQARLREDIALAASLDVRGTPVFLVGGRKVEGGRSTQVIQAMLQSVTQADGTR